MDHFQLHWLLLGFLALQIAHNDSVGAEKCGFPAIFNFGDSNSDTGAMSAAALREFNSPNGESFFGHSTGRFCDGRLVIDFIADDLKLPFLRPYLDSLGTNFRHGANFATGGSSIRPGGYSPFHLGIQVSQFILFKSRTIALFNGNNQEFESKFPRPEDFSRALYTIDIGQNDIYHGLNHTTEKEVRASIPDILNQLSQALHKLYEEGARYFWIHNTGPVGCLPYSIIYYKSKPHKLDKHGCLTTPHNVITIEFNRQLKNMVSQLRMELQGAAFTYVDIYATKYALVSNAANLGFVNPMNFCCGSYYGYQIDCGKKALVNGTTEYGNPCAYPSIHIFWDGFHYSDAANILIAKQILNGSFCEPPVPVQESCHHPTDA